MSSFVLKIKRCVLKISIHSFIYILYILFSSKLTAYFSQYPTSDSEIEEARSDYNKLVEFNYCDKTDFSKSVYGKITLLFVFVIRDVITLIIDLITNKALMIYFKKYLRHKSRLKLGVGNLNNNQGDGENFKNMRNADANLVRISISNMIFSIFLNLTTLVCSLLITVMSQSMYFNYVHVVSALLVLLKHSSNFFFILVTITILEGLCSVIAHRLYSKTIIF